MIGAFLAFTVLTGQVPASDPVALVAQLGSARYAQRETAATTLERLGRQALPALRSARDVKDPEIRARASALISRIEGGLLTKATMVTLAYHNQPLAEIVKSIGDQSGIKLAVLPEQFVAVQQRRLTLTAPAPLPFWKAVDRLCEAAGLQYNVGMHGMTGFREPVFALSPGMSRPQGPVFDSGPFRVSLVRVRHEREVSFPGLPQAAIVNRAGPGRNVFVAQQAGHEMKEQFYAQIQVTAEPRLALAQVQPLKLAEAIDDLGQSYLKPANPNPVVESYHTYLSLPAGSSLQLQALLERPAKPGRVLHRLRGTLPVVVSTRKADPLVIPLNGAAGKTFQNDEFTLRVHEVRFSPDSNKTTIEYTVRANQDAGGDADLLASGIATLSYRRNESSKQQIEFVDSQGREIESFQSTYAEGPRTTLTLNSHDHRTAAEMRYYGVVKATTEVPFEFRDVPIP